MPSPQVLASSAFAAPQPSPEGPCHPLPPPPLPTSPHPSLCFESKGFTACIPPSALSQRPGDPGRGRGCQVGPWGGGRSPAKGPAPVTVGSVLAVRPRQVFYIVNSSYLPIKDFRCSVGRHEACGHRSSLGGGKGPVSVGGWACDTPAFALQQMGCVPHPHSRLFHHLEPFLRSPLDQSSHPTPMKSLAHPIPLSPSRHPFRSITLHCVSPSTGSVLPPGPILSLSTALHSPPWSRSCHLWPGPLPAASSLSPPPSLDPNRQGMPMNTRVLEHPAREQKPKFLQLTRPCTVCLVPSLPSSPCGLPLPSHQLPPLCSLSTLSFSISVTLGSLISLSIHLCIVIEMFVPFSQGCDEE